MENINFVQTKDIFSLNTLKCLRNEYLYNDCQLCFDRCEHNALGIFKNKIKLFEDLCTSCGACIGSCPTQSLELKTFDSIDFIFIFLEKQNNTIIEKIDIPHFGILDSTLLISLVLRAKYNIFLEYHAQISSNDLDYIDFQIKTANNFLASIGFEHSIFLRPHQEEIQTTRRNLFKTLLKTKSVLTKESNLSQKLTEHAKLLPSQLILLKNSLKLVCEDISNTHIETHANQPVFNQKIDFVQCTNCVECITFCPTNALFQNATKESIYFQSGKCIGCAICHAVCKHDAITEEMSIDLIDFMFDKAQKLVEFEYIKCQQCNNVFIDKKQGNICGICSDYANTHTNMFTLAKDL